MISGDWRWIQASALHWPHRPEFHFWAFDLQWWWIGIFDQSMTTHDAFGMAQWQWLKKMWINLHMGTKGAAIDEFFCDLFELPSIPDTIGITLLIMALGFLIYMVYEQILKKMKKNSQKVSFPVTPVEEKVNAIIQALNEGGHLPDDAYQAVHEVDGGIELLFGCTFDFPRHPETWHRIAQLIRAQERKIHENNHREWMACVRYADDVEDDDDDGLRQEKGQEQDGNQILSLSQISEPSPHLHLPCQRSVLLASRPSHQQ